MIDKFEIFLIVAFVCFFVVSLVSVVAAFSTKAQVRENHEEIKALGEKLDAQSQ